MVITFREMLYKRIKPDDQWADLIYPILFTFTHKLVHSTTEFTPNDARKEYYESVPNMNMNKKATHKRRHPELHVGDTVNIYKLNNY